MGRLILIVFIFLNSTCFSLAPIGDGLIFDWAAFRSPDVNSIYSYFGEKGTFSNAYDFKGKSVLFNGINNQLSFGVLSSLAIGDVPQTHVFVIKTAVNNTWLYAYRNNIIGGISYFLSSDGLIRMYKGTTGQSTGNTTRVDDGKIHVFIAVYEISKVTYYLDGVYDGEDSTIGGTYTDGAPLVIGNRFGGGNYWDGEMYEVGVFLNAFTLSQIRHQSNELTKMYKAGN